MAPVIECTLAGLIFATGLISIGHVLGLLEWVREASGVL